jgi:hypothetical protein
MIGAMVAKTETLDPALAEREQALRTLRAHAPALRARGVVRLGLFGSIARGEASPDSDVDLLIEIDPQATFTLVELAGLERFPWRPSRSPGGVRLRPPATRRALVPFPIGAPI